MWWTTGSGKIELEITKDQAAQGSHSGSCDDDIALLREVPEIREQLALIDKDLLAEELSEYGAWDEKELKDHDENISRILWLACGDIDEEEIDEKTK